jgi:hypothetical protein
VSGVLHLARMGGDPASEMRKVNDETHLLKIDRFARLLSRRNSVCEVCGGGRADARVCVCYVDTHTHTHTHTHTQTHTHITRKERLGTRGRRHFHYVVGAGEKLDERMVACIVHDRVVWHKGVCTHHDTHSRAMGAAGHSTG